MVEAAIAARLAQLDGDMRCDVAAALLEETRLAAQARQEQLFARLDAMRHKPIFADWCRERGLTVRAAPQGLPRDWLAETAILGAMIGDVPGEFRGDERANSPGLPSGLPPGAVQRGLARLRPRHFSDSRFVPIFRAVAALNQRGANLWPDTVEIQLMLSGTLAEAGGSAMVEALWRARCAPGEIDVLIGAVLEAAQLRAAALGFERLTRLAHGGLIEPARWLSIARRALDEIEQRAACDVDALLEGKE